MTIESIKQLLAVKDDEFAELVKDCRKRGVKFYLTDAYKELNKTIKNLEYQLKELTYEKELQEGKIYNDSEWITKKNYVSNESYEKAKATFIEMLSKLNGVEVIDDKVNVTTRWKIHMFSIRMSNVDEDEINLWFKVSLKYEGWEWRKD